MAQAQRKELFYMTLFFLKKIFYYNLSQNFEYSKTLFWLYISSKI